jgi:hypothetical protein
MSQLLVLMLSCVNPYGNLLAGLKKHKYAEDYKKELAALDPSWRCCDKMVVRSLTSGTCSIHCPNGSVTSKSGCYTGD